MSRERYELKFPIHVSQKRRVIELARQGLVADSHGTDAAYRVSSMYFDTPGLLAYRQKLDGEAVRRKFRLRYYAIDGANGLAVSSAFMEIKHRDGNTGYKDRLALTDAGAEAILHDASELLRLNEHVAATARDKLAAINEVEHTAAMLRLRAALVITYWREAWEGSVDHRLRVTFDTRCEALRPPRFRDVATGTGKLILPASQCIMEVKFNSLIPRWLRDVVAGEHIQLRRFSKYAAGVDALGLAAL
jgi:SPX domain protein involved in polyphosphate accumulation